MKTLPSWPKNLPKVSSYNTVRFGDQDFNMWILEEHKHSNHGSKLSRSSSPLAWPVVLIGALQLLLAFLWYILHTAFWWVFYVLAHPQCLSSFLNNFLGHQFGPSSISSVTWPLLSLSYAPPIFCTLLRLAPIPTLSSQAWLRAFIFLVPFCLESTLL